MSFIYYTGVGDYRADHCYTKEEFITLCKENKEYIDELWELNENEYNIQFDMLIQCTGANYITFC